MPRYFAYGSNLVTEQIKRRCPTFAKQPTVVGRARLPGYRLTFPIESRLDWAGGVAGIEPIGEGHAAAGAAAAAHGVVHGVVYDIDDDAAAQLDIYEDVAGGLYRRADIRVTLDDGQPCACMTYLPIPAPDGPFPPSQRYLDAIIAGARAHGLPASWIAQLEQTPTLTR